MAVFTHQLEHAKTCLEWRRKGHRGWFHTPPDCYKITAQCKTGRFLESCQHCFVGLKILQLLASLNLSPAQERQKETAGLKVKGPGIHGLRVSRRPHLHFGLWAFHWNSLGKQCFLSIFILKFWLQTFKPKNSDETLAVIKDPVYTIYKTRPWQPHRCSSGSVDRYRNAKTVEM